MTIDYIEIDKIRESIANLPQYDGVESFAESFMRNESRHPYIRYTKAFCESWDNSPAIIGETEHIIGVPKSPSVVFPSIIGLLFNQPLMEHMCKTCSDADKEKLMSISDYFRGKHITTDLINIESINQKSLLDFSIGNGASFQGHMVVDYEKVLKIGISGLKNEVLSAIKSCDDAKKLPFYESMLLLCENMRNLIHRYAIKTIDLLEDEFGERRQELIDINHACLKISNEPPSSFIEALQLFWFVFLLDGNDDPGRFDQYMYQFYINDIKNEIISQDDALILLIELWYKMNQVTAWSLVLGGMKPDGSDAVNELTFLCLQVTELLRLTNPAIALRVNKNSPDEIWHAAMKCISKGGGHPSIVNDDAVVEAMISSGIPLPDARDYAMGGCIEFQIAGKSNFGGEDGQINIAKCLELALNNGHCALTNKLIGVETGDPTNFNSFNDVISAFKTQVEVAGRKIINQCNIGQEIKHKQGVKLFRSILIDDCIKRGIDCEGGGALYGNGQILTDGLIVAADSLTVIKKLVFEDKSITMKQLVRALHDNWNGHEDILHLVKRVTKYGNDDVNADKMAHDIALHFWNYIKQFKTYRGGHYTGLVVYYNRQLYYGSQTASTPDGRYNCDVIEDSIGPWPGRDTNGPTAMMRSAASIPQKLAAGGVILNLKLTSSCFRTINDINKTIDLIRGYFNMGGQQVQITVADYNDLKCAMNDPDKWRHLIVRVGGYSDYFVNLDKNLQKSILDRTACKLL